MIGGKGCSAPSGSAGTDLALPVSGEADGRSRGTPGSRKAIGVRLMTLFIGCDLDAGIRVVRLEGWLEGESVAELERVMRGGSGPLRLNLCELRSADAAGLVALRALRAGGASLVGASPYIKLLLG